MGGHEGPTFAQSDLKQGTDDPSRVLNGKFGGKLNVSLSAIDQRLALYISRYPFFS